MTTNHIDQLAEWWENAEPGIPGAGDTVIFDERHRSLGFHVTQASTDHPRGYENARILARAPKPKPAWHDAIAVIATWDSGGDEEHRGLWTYNGAGMWINVRGTEVHRDYLTDVTPLIEAKVTDELVKRGAQASNPIGVRYLRPHEVREVLTAALGLDPA